jgi:hypothetical protein
MLSSTTAVSSSVSVHRLEGGMAGPSGRMHDRTYAALQRSKNELID